MPKTELGKVFSVLFGDLTDNKYTLQSSFLGLGKKITKAAKNR